MADGLDPAFGNAAADGEVSVQDQDAAQLVTLAAEDAAVRDYAQGDTVTPLSGANRGTLGRVIEVRRGVFPQPMYNLQDEAGNTFWVLTEELPPVPAPAAPAAPATPQQ